MNFNNNGIKIFQYLKEQFISKRKKIRTIRFGLLRGVQMQIGLDSQMQLYLGLNERETYAWMKKLCKGVNTIVDAGAACGEQTLFFMKKTTARKIYAFEPQKDVLEELKLNIALNALGAKAEISLSPKLIGSKNENDTVTLDSFYDQITFPCMIKIDIEGAEIDALEGAHRLLKSREVRWFIETHSEDCEDKCRDMLMASGYETKIIKNAWWRLFIPEERGPEQNRWLVAYRSNDRA